jgi:hypothetical protein
MKRTRTIIGVGDVLGSLKWNARTQSDGKEHCEPVHCRYLCGAQRGTRRILAVIELSSPLIRPRSAGRYLCP